MLCEVLLSSLWFLFVIFWFETIVIWLFLSMFYQDRAFYHWGDGVFADDPGQMIYLLSSRYPYADRDADLRREKIKNYPERTLNGGLLQSCD